MNRNGGRGNGDKARLRLVEPSKMLTRGRQPQAEDMDEKMNATLKAAGIENVETMGEDEKKSLFEAIQSSMGAAPVEKEDYFPQNSPGIPNDNQEQSPDIFADIQSEPSNNDMIVEENVGRPMRPAVIGQPGTSQTPRSVGRGRGKPVRTKYPGLPINASPGQRPDPASGSPMGSKLNQSSNQPASPMTIRNSTSAASAASSSGFQNNLPRTMEDTSDPLSPLSPPGSQVKQDSPDELSQDFADDVVGVEGGSQETDDDVLVDVESAPVRDSEPDSPASVQDACEDEKDPVKTVLIGKTAAQVSPLESMNRDLPGNDFSNFILEFANYRGNRQEWMAKTSEMVERNRKAYFKKLKEDNPIWDPPIVSGTKSIHSMRTFFKETIPEYSSLFTNSSEKQAVTQNTSGRGERQSKIRAATKIQEALTDDFDEPEFVSLRRSKQKDIRNQDHGGRQSNNPWNNRKQQDIEINDDGPGEDISSSPSSDKWPSHRSEQGIKSADGDFEHSEPSKSGGSQDVYEYDEDDHDEIWEKPTNRNKKNFKKGGGRSAEGDVELEAKTPGRPRGAGAPQQNQRQRNTKLRLQKGAISHPSQHGQPPRQKGGFSEETNARNSANNDGRWLNSNPEIDNDPVIAAKNFYSKAVQPRPRDNVRPEQSPSSPSTSGGSPENVQCPICSKFFTGDKIETHASDCFSIDGPAEGEESNFKDQDDEESDNAVEEVENLESNSKDAIEGRPHKKQCTKTVHSDQGTSSKASTVSTKKRANSINDDGPVKKTRCGE